MSENSRILCWLACALTGAFSAPAMTQDASALLARADSFRIAPGGSRLDSTVVAMKGGQVVKERTYTVLLDDGNKALVLFRNPAEAGQKVLVISNEFWVIFPRSKRPVRISPLQRLVGDAATGDIALTSWAEDYDAQLEGAETLDSRDCLRLRLLAKRSSVSYQVITLWIDSARHFPVAADLFVGSGRLAKKVTFQVKKTSAGGIELASMTLVDAIERESRTIVTYSDRRKVEIPAQYFNPMYLVSNAVAL